jgi:hypothetical protein
MAMKRNAIPGAVTGFEGEMLKIIDFVHELP